MSRLSTFLLSASLCASRAAFADPTDDSLIDAGLRHRREHRDAEALDEFRRAYESRPSPRARAQIGFAEQALGQWPEAERSLGAALETREDPWISTHIDAIQAALTTVRQHLGSLVVDANVSGAELWMHGAKVATLPMSPARFAEGSLEIEVRAPGYEPVHRTVDVPGGGIANEHFEFAARLGSEPQPSSAALAAAPSRKPAVAAPLREAPVAVPTTRRTLAWGAAGATGAFLGAGLVSQIISQVNVGRYNDDGLCLFGNLTRDQRCGAYRGRAEAAQTFANVAYMSAGVMAVASVVLFIEPPRGSKTAGVTPWIDARATSWQVGCGGAF